MVGEKRRGLDVLDKRRVGLLVWFLRNGNIRVDGGYLGEGLVVGKMGKVRIVEGGVLMVGWRGRVEIVECSGDKWWGIRWGDL